MKELNKQEKRVYDYLCQMLNDNGYSPSVRDIMAATGFKSTSTVFMYLKRLEEAGYIQKEDGKSRTLRIEGAGKERKTGIPVLGYVRAGSPIIAEQNFDGYIDFTVPNGYRKDNLFALNVTGESMKDAGILNGDAVIVNRTDYAENGDIVVALVDDEATVKVFYKENGKFRLQPKNKDFKPIITDKAELLGKVIACVRFY